MGPIAYFLGVGRGFHLREGFRNLLLTNGSSTSQPVSLMSSFLFCTHRSVSLLGFLCFG